MKNLKYKLSYRTMIHREGVSRFLVTPVQKSVEQLGTMEWSLILFLRNNLQSMLEGP